MIYVGTFHRTMDAKNRVTVPSEWIGEEGEVLYMLPAQSGSYLNVMPAAEFAQQEETLRASVPAAEWRKIMRKIFRTRPAHRARQAGTHPHSRRFLQGSGLSANITFAGVKKSLRFGTRRNGRASEPETELSEESRKALERLAISGETMENFTE